MNKIAQNLVIFGFLSIFTGCKEEPAKTVYVNGCQKPCAAGKENDPNSTGMGGSPQNSSNQGPSNPSTTSSTPADGLAGAKDEVVKASSLVQSVGIAPANGRGATLPWIEYQAEDAQYTGKLIGPSRRPGNIAAEASGRQAVVLEATGQYVQFKTTADANSIVLRYSIPDTTDSAGQDATIGIYVNDVRVKSLVVTSKYAYVYGSESSPSYAYGPAPRRYYDESRALLNTIPAGSTVKIQKDKEDKAESYVIDFIDLEAVGPALEKPADYLSITDFGAVPDDGIDDFNAIQAAMDAGSKQKKGVWIPKGEFRIQNHLDSTGERDFIRNYGISLKGAGMWYSTLQGPGASLACYGNGCTFANFAVTGETSTREDETPDNGFDGGAGKGTRLENVWVERTKVGYWCGKNKAVPKLDRKKILIVTDGLVITGSRFRNLYADGINLANGAINSVIENTSIRYSGDDGIAIWSLNWEGDFPGKDNIVKNNTVELPWRANCFAIYGGAGNKIENSLCKDTLTYPGILISSGFGSHPFTNLTSVNNVDIIRGGGDFWGFTHGALKVNSEETKTENLLFQNIDIVDATGPGIQFQGKNNFDNITFKNINVKNPGSEGIHVMKDVTTGKVSFEGVVVTTPHTVPFKSDAAMMDAFVMTKGMGNVGW